MANEISSSLKSAAETVAQYVQNIATLTVETRSVDVGAPNVSFTTAAAVARTEIKLDGDCNAVVPMRKNAEGVSVVDESLFEAHQKNVATAIDYRTRMMGALLQTLRQAVSGTGGPSAPLPPG